MKNILILGATGSIGKFIYNNFKEDENYNVIGTSSKETDNYLFVNNDNLLFLANFSQIELMITILQFSLTLLFDKR